MFNIFKKKKKVDQPYTKAIIYYSDGSISEWFTTMTPLEAQRHIPHVGSKVGDKEVINWEWEIKIVFPEVNSLKNSWI